MLWSTGSANLSSRQILGINCFCFHQHFAWFTLCLETSSGEFLASRSKNKSHASQVPEIVFFVNKIQFQGCVTQTLFFNHCSSQQFHCGYNTVIKKALTMCRMTNRKSIQTGSTEHIVPSHFYWSITITLPVTNKKSITHLLKLPLLLPDLGNTRQRLVSV